MTDSETRIFAVDWSGKNKGHWYIHHHFATNAPEFWAIVACAGESWLGTCPWPFFDLRRSQQPGDCDLFRRTELIASGAKSTFQIGGPGAVGVGSVRGMPLLLQLRDAGWKIWPFDPPGFPRAVEIYPRLVTGSVVKTVWNARLRFLETRFPDLAPRYAERAAGSEDAFDAAVSALVMDEHRRELINSLEPPDEVDRIEGRIWRP
jgi:hypothetical protein